VIAGILASGAMVHVWIVLFIQSGHRTGAEMTYQIDDSGLVQLRPKHPDLRIAFDQIASANEDKQWLIIRSRIDGKVMMVYRKVNDYGKLRQIVGEHHKILTGQPIRKNTYFAAARLAALVIAWALFLLPGNTRLRYAAAVAVVVFLAWASPAYWKLCHRVSRLRAAVGLGAAWACAIYLLVAYWSR